jgi:mannose-6-phosphate isomerase-like protein (cupin superfamily)
MLVKKTHECQPYTAIDGCDIREVLHPAHHAVALPYSLAVAEVAPGGRTYRHRLQADEVYFLLAGKGRMHIADETSVLDVGDTVFIPAHAVQWIENIGDGVLRFVALVSPPWESESDQRLD